jgi:hypothetical protein
LNDFNIVFKINKAEDIIIELNEALENVHCCYNADIFYINNLYKTSIASDFIRYSLAILKGLLTKALKNKLRLHRSITNDIGYLYNEELQDKPGLFYKTSKEGRKFWIGESYSLWNSSLDSWLYNDKDGNIIFEITPTYPSYYTEPETSTDYISYEEWIKSYKPFLIRKIPVEVARQWLDQANAILKKIEENVARNIAEGEALEREKKEKEQLASSCDANEDK